MAHKKAGGSSRNGRDSAGRRLGVKKFGGEIKTLNFFSVHEKLFIKAYHPYHPYHPPPPSL